MKDKLAAAINWLKDKYLWLVDWVDDHPQMSIWIAAVVIIAALVF